MELWWSISAPLLIKGFCFLVWQAPTQSQEEKRMENIIHKKEMDLSLLLLL